MGQNAIWMNFKNQLLSKNRFTDTSEVKRVLGIIFEENCEKVIIKQGTIMYRARPIDISDINLMGPNFYGFDDKNSLSPPKAFTTPGRLNCAKLPLLYLAEDEYTALAEVRPAKKSKVSIATIKLKKDFTLLKFDYFQDTNIDDNEISSIINDIKHLLYFPVMDDYKEQYLPTQFIASLIEENGYDGVAYSSSQSSKGMNIGMFDLDAGEAVETKVYMLQSVLYYAEEILPRRDDNFLIPSSFKGKFTIDQVNNFLKEFQK